MQRSAPLLAPLFALVAIGCVGDMDTKMLDGQTPREPGDAGLRDRKDMSHQEGHGDDSGGAMPDVEMGMRLPPEPPPMPMRRLSDTELTLTIEDIFEIDLPDVAPNSTGHGFDNQVADHYVDESRQSDYLNRSDQVAQLIVARHQAQTPCEGAQDQAAARACARDIIDAYGAKLWRRPLSTEDMARILGVYDKGFARDGHEEGLHGMFQYVLLSSHFLYRPELTAPQTRVSDWELATRLSYFLWRSAPDDLLLEAAAAGTLSDPAELEAQVRRMLEDERARDTIGRFFAMLFEVDGLRGAEKQEEAWNQEVASQLIDDFEALSAALVLDEGATFDDLWSSRRAVIDPTTAWIYGVDPDPQNPAALVDLAHPGAGLLTHPAVMAQFAKYNYASSVMRGYFVRTRVLCELVAPPGANIIQEEPEVLEDNPVEDPFAYTLTTEPCSTCHVSMNPIGTAMGAYDSVGRYAPVRQMQQVDTVGRIVGGLAPADGLDGAAALGAHLSTSRSVHECIASQWLTYAWGDRLSEGHGPVIEELGTKTQQGHTLKDFIVTLTTSDTFLGR